MNAFTKDIVIYFGDYIARVSPEQLARDCGVSVADVALTIDRFLECGYLALRPDGAFEAVIPPERGAHG